MGEGGGGEALSLFRFHLSPFPQKRLILRLLSSGGERIKHTHRTYILQGTFPVAVDEIQNTHQTRSVPLNLPGSLQNQKEKKR